MTAERKYMEKVPQNIQDAIFNGRKIEAIKYTREELGLGLKEAKEFVDKLSGALAKEFPDQMTAVPQAKGCLVLVIGFIACAAIIIAGIS